MTSDPREFLQDVHLPDVEAAKLFLRNLIDNRCDYHLEDDPFEVVGPNGVGPDGRVFTDREAEVLRKQVKYMFSMDWGKYGCPIGYMLAYSEDSSAR